MQHLRNSERRLSLRGRNYTTLDFHAQAVGAEGRRRVAEFRAVWRRASAYDQRILNQISWEMQRFGYDAFNDAVTITRSKSVFDAWNLMLQ